MIDLSFYSVCTLHFRSLFAANNSFETIKTSNTILTVMGKLIDKQLVVDLED